MKKSENNINKKEKIDLQAKKNREKSDRRFYVRAASLAAIIPAYVGLLVCAAVLPRSTVSNIEKRNLATFPEFSWSDYWSGKYTADIANYFDDTVPNRDDLKLAASRFTSLFGIKYNDVQITGTMEVVNPKPKADASSDNDDDDEKSNNKKNNESAAASSKSYGGSIKKNGSDSDKDDNKKKKDSDKEKQVKGEEIAEGVYANGVIVVYQDGHYRAMSMYGGGYGDTFADSVNNYASDLPGVRVYALVAPTASEFYTPENFADYNASQEDDIIEINDMLRGATGINVCPALLSHKKENIYTRTDHHWMSLGAYYAAKEFASAAKTSFLDISQYERKVKSDYVGTLYTFSGNNADLLNDPEDFVYYVPKKKDYTAEYHDQAFNFVYEGDIFVNVEMKSEYYSTFISGDAYSVKISTGTKNGRRCMVVKDSYGDAFVPFLTGSFEEIYVVDMRYFECNLVEFCEEMGITDLLFTCCSYSAVGPNADHLEDMRTSGYSLSGEEEDEQDDEDELDLPELPEVTESEPEQPDETASEVTEETSSQEDTQPDDYYEEGDYQPEDDQYGGEDDGGYYEEDEY